MTLELRTFGRMSLAGERCQQPSTMDRVRTQRQPHRLTLPSLVDFAAVSGRIASYEFDRNTDDIQSGHQLLTKLYVHTRQ